MGLSLSRFAATRTLLPSWHFHCSPAKAGALHSGAELGLGRSALKPEVARAAHVAPGPPRAPGGARRAAPRPSGHWRPHPGREPGRSHTWEGARVSGLEGDVCAAGYLGGPRAEAAQGHGAREPGSGRPRRRASTGPRRAHLGTSGPCRSPRQGGLSPQAAGARYSRERLPLPRAVCVCRRPAGRSHSAPSALGRSRQGDRRGTPSDSRGSRAPAQGSVPAGALRLPACGRCGCGSPPAGSSGVYLTPQRAMVQFREP